MTSAGRRTFDELLQEIVDLKEAQEAVNWTIADRIATAIDLARRDGQRRVSATLGHHLGYSARWVEILARTARAFPGDPDPERTLRRPDIPFALYVVAGRTPDPARTLLQALSEGWTSAQLARQIAAARTGQPEETPVCSACGRPYGRKRR